METTMADSTNDLYQLQVSPLASSSEGGCFFCSYPAVSAVYWREGSGIKECLGDQEKQELPCRKKINQLLPDGFGWLELPNWPGYRRARATRRSSCSWVKGSGMPLASHVWAKGRWHRQVSGQKRAEISGLGGWNGGFLRQLGGGDARSRTELGAIVTGEVVALANKRKRFIWLDESGSYMGCD